MRVTNNSKSVDHSNLSAFAANEFKVTLIVLRLFEGLLLDRRTEFSNGPVYIFAADDLLTAALKNEFVGFQYDLNRVPPHCAQSLVVVSTAAHVLDDAPNTVLVHRK